MALWFRVLTVVFDHLGISCKKKRAGKNYQKSMSEISDKSFELEVSLTHVNTMI